MRNARPVLDLKRVLAGAQLPALPQSAIRLLELSHDPSNGPAEFAKPIEADPGLTGQVLRFVNSSYFGFAREISNVKLAITLVGVRTIKNFALWSAVFSLMPNPKCGSLDLKGLWQDSLRRALFARLLGRLLGIKDAEEEFSAALLQDMAVPLLAKEASDLYAKLLTAREAGRFRLSYLEQELFGWNHAEAAGIMARQWNLPADFTALIEGHCAPEQWLSQPEPTPGKFAVALSALLPANADAAWLDGPQCESLYEKVRPADGPQLVELLAQVDRGFEEFAPLLKLSTPTKSLVERYHEAMTPSS